MSTTARESARFDARLPKEQKEYFEKAAYLGGYRNLTDFVIMTVQERSSEIIRERELIIASERDSEVFFDALTKVRKPSKTLKNALKDYNGFSARLK